MRKILIAGAALFAIAPFASAAPCTSGTLADYLSLGSGGCTVGATTFSNFQSLTGISGATAIAAVDITVNPTGGQFDPGLAFSASQTAGAGSLLEGIFTYSLSGSSFTDAALALAGASETEDGAVTALGNFCAGGTFDATGVSGCSGTPGSLVTLDGVQNNDESEFSPVSSLSVTDDFTLDGGLSGSATGGDFANSFMAVPEPATFLFAGLGLILAAGAGIRSKKATDLKGAIDE